MTTLFASFLGLGLQEIIIIAILGIVLFGATRLPDLGRSLGKTVTGFREGMKGHEESAEPMAQPPGMCKVEPEPIKPPQRLTTPTFNGEHSPTPKA